jgi:malonyl-CoA/methylmalonyl-CoA synthetase
VVVLKSGGELTLAALKDWCDGKLSAYKIPKKLVLQDALPRNAMGKVTKPALRTLF